MKNPLFLRMVVLVATVMCARGVSSAQEAYACHTSEDSTLTFYNDSQRSARTGITYNLNTGDNTPGWSVGFKGYAISQVVFDPSFAAARPTSTYEWFSNMPNLRSITGLNYLNTEEVTTMFGMFSICSSLTTLDLSSFNTTNVKTMRLMFSFCESLKSIDLSSFNTSSVTNMSHMFWGCKSVASIDLSSFNTSNVKNMEGMFDDCESLTSLDLSGFNTEKLLYTNAMFSGCKSLAFVDLTSFNTSNVEQTTSMFSGCESLKTLDLSSFKTGKIWRMRSMFSGCNNLETIYAGEGWSTDSVTVSQDMFYGCTKLVGGQGTAYDENHVDATYAHIDGGPSNPGYLTEKDDIIQRGDVNGDGEVNVADVNCIIDVILGAPDTYGGRADVNDDGEITIADINALIDIILGGGAPNPDNHEYVDLGLPSGTLWATCNVGANAPEEYGDYFAWGETEPKEVYSINNYKWCNGSEDTITKYCTDSSYGTVDNKTELDPEDDAAYVNWGPSWRMPTKEQQYELIVCCTTTWTSRNGVYGQLLTGRNGNSIFMPVAGIRWGESLDYPGSDGNYWSCTLPQDLSYYAYHFWVHSDGLGWGCTPRYVGLTVRPVRVSKN